MLIKNYQNDHFFLIISRSYLEGLDVSLKSWLTRNDLIQNLSKSSPLMVSKVRKNIFCGIGNSFMAGKILLH